MRKHSSADETPEAIAKRELRNVLRNQRRERFTEESWLHILEAPEMLAASRIASYLSYGDEPQTTDLNASIIASGKVLYLPRMLPDRDLEWVVWNGEPSRLTQSGKIQEPIGASITDEELREISVVIVPSLHVDRDGTRLGQGGGSYDRALARMKAWRIGLVHFGEITSDPLPRQEHDRRLHAAATPDLIVRFH